MTASKALVIGGSGQIGQAAAARLLEDGWDVTVASRGKASPPVGAHVRQVDRADDESMDAILKECFDVVVDVVAFDPQHVDQLSRRAGDIGSIVAISTGGLYVDTQGRALEAITDLESSPRFNGPVPESARTVGTGTGTYASRKRAVELALANGPVPATVIRPATVHGPNTPQAREWFYLRRILDGRRTFVLGFDGQGSYHPVSTGNLAEMIRLAARNPGHRILNAGDPGSPTERDIAAGIAEAMNVSVEFVLVPGQPPVASPWSLPAPVFLDTEAARTQLGYEPALTYAAGVALTVESLLRDVASGAFHERLADSKFGNPGLGVRTFFGGTSDPFDYGAEDRAISTFQPT
ncbi:NAD-dependent epimerase/dehydratase family protein [Pseudarthrobacter sulfonivorans]|uniref:NAD-dependent epimerase/dehydratase family protein n=1 Tax=Pseudarthrobacter sulfonivorans TaxID=121292 RepID=UPI002105410A|nr:NAD-dependent epimerase/dehydratase family protein [Pseudarthrobacter sulfonivorans]